MKRIIAKAVAVSFVLTSIAVAGKSDLPFPQKYVTDHCRIYSDDKTSGSLTIHRCGTEPHLYYCWVRGNDWLSCGSFDEIVTSMAETLARDDKINAAQRQAVRESFLEATTTLELAAYVTAYLEFIGELDKSLGESYSETAKRLSDELMELAAQRERILETQGKNKEK